MNVEMEEAFAKLREEIRDIKSICSAMRGLMVGITEDVRFLNEENEYATRLTQLDWLVRIAN